ncbi:hypothetical protein ELH66_34760 [Rhizobium ruizarguesonis]|nr:hypothetical protein ELH66_34760 [Rhizobium ruizarguesonis]
MSESTAISRQLHHSRGHDPSALGDWLARHDAWKFGWEAEDACREGRIVVHSKEPISIATQRPLDA